MPSLPAEIASHILRTCAAGRIRQINRVVTAQFDAELREHGITANQLTILALATALGPSRGADLEPYLVMEQSTLSRNVNRMVDNGWLEKRADPEDGRSQLLAVTRDGTELLEAAYGSWQQAQQWAEELIGTTRLEGIATVARTVNPNIP